MSHIRNILGHSSVFWPVLTHPLFLVDTVYPKLGSGLPASILTSLKKKSGFLGARYPGSPPSGSFHPLYCLVPLPYSESQALFQEVYPAYTHAQELSIVPGKSKLEERFVSTLPTLFLSHYSNPYSLTFRLRGSRSGYDWKNRLGPVRGGILYVIMSARVHCREVYGAIIPSGGHGSEHRLGGQAK